MGESVVSTLGRFTKAYDEAVVPPISKRNVCNFSKDLIRSHSASDSPIWEEVYRKAFSNFQTMVDHRGNGEHQKAGIDRSVILDNSKQILIDEKVRFESYETDGYDDIALEYISVDSSNSPGWVCKPLRCDYIAYAILPKSICYLLPVIQLQQAWINKKDVWFQQYKEKPAKNENYLTWFLPVPCNVLFAAIGACLRISFTPMPSQMNAVTEPVQQRVRRNYD